MTIQAYYPVVILVLIAELIHPVNNITFNFTTDKYSRPYHSFQGTLILKFLDRSELQSARLLHKFSNMAAVTVCARLHFSPACHGPSTVFSYSTRSFINEFQLQARVMPNQPIQLALLVHGNHGPYLSVFPNDASWHSMCVSWTGNGGKWAISVDGQAVQHGISLYSSGYVGGGGIFIIGQEQDAFSSSFRRDQAFCGSITQLNMWDQVLDANEIQTMDKECSLVPSGLLFRWGRSGLEMTPSLQTHWGYTQCQGKALLAVLDSILYLNWLKC